MGIRLAKLVSTCCVLISGLQVGAPGRTASAGSFNGVAGSTPAYYDGTLFTITLSKLSPGSTLLAKNSQQNTIYMSDPGLPGGLPFIAVIDAILADGFNPLWAEVQITFTAGHTPRQLFSDDEVAAAAASGEITLSSTGEIYECAVIGKPSAGTARGSGGAASPGRSGSSWGRIKAAYR